MFLKQSYVFIRLDSKHFGPKCMQNTHIMANKKRAKLTWTIHLRDFQSNVCYIKIFQSYSADYFTSCQYTTQEVDFFEYKVYFFPKICLKCVQRTIVRLDVEM